MVVFVEITSSFYHILVNIWYVKDCYAHTITWNMFLFSSSHLNFFENSNNSTLHKALSTFEIMNFLINLCPLGLPIDITYHHYWDNY